MRRLLGDEGGISLVEVIIAGALTVGFAAVLLTFLYSAQGAVVTQTNRGIANDQARAAMDQLDREVRSANFIYVDDPESLLVHTQSNAPTAGNRCVEWTIANGELLRREWPTNDPANASGWRIIATDIVNVEEGIDTFVLPDFESNRVKTGGRSVEVRIVVEAAEDATSSLQLTLSGRNVVGGPPAPGDTWPPTTPPPPCDVIP